jgi:glucan phosphoethanolaminetransferase (alkaline phosphatase superfamily)
MAFANLWATSGYFLGSTLPNKLRKHGTGDGIQAPPAVIQSHPDVNIIIVMGESLRRKSMSLFGYERETTPHLSQLAKEGVILARQAVSAGVSTDVSVPLFFNAVAGLEAMPVVISQSRCLFKLAKMNGFETHLYSIQNVKSMHHILNYICPDQIDHIHLGINPENRSEDDTYLDEELLATFDKIDFTRPQFVVLQQRGSHGPYEHRFPPSFAKFQVQPGDSYETTQLKNYDNSVYYTDFVLSQLIKKARAIKNRKTYFIFTPDHSEAMGEEQVWGHNILAPPVTDIPFLFYSNDRAVVSEVQSWPNVVDHLDIANLVLRLAGLSGEKPAGLPRKMIVLGPDIEGLGGGMYVSAVEGAGPADGIQFDYRAVDFGSERKSAISGLVPAALSAPKIQ